MPKIGTTSVRSEELRVDVNIYYVSEKYNPHFIVTPVKEEFINMAIDGMSHRTIARGRSVIGVKGDTEEDALLNFKEYLKVWKEITLTRIPVILIAVRESAGENLYYKEERNSQSKQTGCRIDFHYHFCYEIILDGKKRYFKDGKYNRTGTDQEVWNHEQSSYVIVPGTPENLTRCEQIVEQMNKITDTLIHLFGSTEKAQATLSNNINLLDNHE